MEKEYLTVYSPSRPRSPSFTNLATLFHRSSSAPDKLSQIESGTPVITSATFQTEPDFVKADLNANNQNDNYIGSDKFNTHVPLREFCGKRCVRFFPITKWLPKYTGRKFIHDFLAGLLVGLTVIPQALALSLMAGLPPQYGLYSGFMGCFVYVFFGSTSYITIGPTAVMSIMTWTYGHDKPPEYVVLLTFITGVVTLSLGLMQLGFIHNFISIPVASGFTSAAAVTICYTQLKGLLGIQFQGVGFIDIVTGAINHIKDVGMWDVIVAGLCLIVLLILRKLELIFSCLVKRGKPWSKIIWLISVSKGIIVTFLCTGVFAMIGSDSIVGILGQIRPGIPFPAPPPFSFSKNYTQPYSLIPINKSFHIMDIIKDDATVLLVFPFLALMEHSLNAKQFSGAKSIDFSQELIANG
ncbi:Sodium-independent sulfate anion transporter [Folsomia candida]|uniref:Sodium-independent sulfate anion transporter n=2 Tax=Folsomia candida TaxID=158441 RepID=A0A226CZF2_FOLCA|nr:Sodium-independent sulfate anion transporter [Folsomia candida]